MTDRKMKMKRRYLHSTCQGEIINLTAQRNELWEERKQLREELRRIRKDLKRALVILSGCLP